jgi:hypothetical protein
MRVLQLGVGAIGEITARVAAQEPAVETVVLAEMSRVGLSTGSVDLPAR